MKLPCSPQTRSHAFTVMELLMVMGTSLLVIGAVLGTHLYGLRVTSRVQVKLAASDDARQAVSMLIQDIRSAKSMRIGSGSTNTFTDAPVDGPQVGDAIQLFPTTATNVWIRYFYNPSDNSLRRCDGSSTATLVTANSITNDNKLFTQENFRAQTNMTRTPIGLVEVNISFTQLRNPLVRIGPGNYFDFYQLQTRICPRTTL